MFAFLMVLEDPGDVQKVRETDNKKIVLCSSEMDLMVPRCGKQKIAAKKSNDYCNVRVGHSKMFS